MKRRSSGGPDVPLSTGQSMDSFLAHRRGSLPVEMLATSFSGKNERNVSVANRVPRLLRHVPFARQFFLQRKTCSWKAYIISFTSFCLKRRIIIIISVIREHGSTRYTRYTVWSLFFGTFTIHVYEMLFVRLTRRICMFSGPHWNDHRIFTHRRLTNENKLDDKICESIHTMMIFV